MWGGMSMEMDMCRECAISPPLYSSSSRMVSYHSFIVFRSVVLAEALTLECYTVLMDRMKENFPHHAGMDRCLSNLRSLVQVVDPQIFSLLSTSADFTQLYFSYRWFLLDFKRGFANIPSRLSIPSFRIAVWRCIPCVGDNLGMWPSPIKEFPSFLLTCNAH